MEASHVESDLALEIRSAALVGTHERLRPDSRWAGENARLVAWRRGDAFRPTTVVAYAAKARRRLQRALEAEVPEGDLTEAEAMTIARRLMHDNQYSCFDIDGTRKATRARLATTGTT